MWRTSAAEKDARSMVADNICSFFDKTETASRPETGVSGLAQTNRPSRSLILHFLEGLIRDFGKRFAAHSR
jgi:hypothetical protein